LGKSQRIPVGFPPIVRDVIKQQVGVLGNSESEVVKNIVLIYLTERGMLKKRNSSGKKQEGRR
jgi:hypothetical protein